MSEVIGSIATSISKAPTMVSPVSINPVGEFTGGGLGFSPSTPSIFKDTVSFSGSIFSVPEGPISRPSSIFDQGQFEVIAKPISAVFMPPVVQSGTPELVFSPTMPVIAVDNSQHEASTRSAVNPNLSLGFYSPVIPSVETQESKPKQEVAEVRIPNNLRLLRIVAELKANEQIEEKEKVGIKTGLPKPEEEAKPDIRTEQEIRAELGGFIKPRVVLEEDEKLKALKQESRPGRRHYVSLRLAVDEKAQAYRKKTAKEIVAFAFKISRLFHLPFVSGKEIALSLEERREHKSKLLAQLDVPRFPDGSFYQAAGQIYDLPRVQDTTDKGEWLMHKRTAQILDENRPIELVEGDFAKRANPHEARRVLRFVEYVFRWA